jgi:hypothetical protein
MAPGATRQIPAISEAEAIVTESVRGLLLAVGASLDQVSVAMLSLWDNDTFPGRD